MRGRVAGGLVHGPRPEVGVDLDARAAARGRARRSAAMPVGCRRAGASRRSARAARRGPRTGARPPCAGAAPPPGRWPSGPCARGRDASTARTRSRRRSPPPARSGRSARACRPGAARAPGLQVDHRQRPLEVPHRAVVVIAAVEQHDAVAGGHRPGVAVRHARPRERQPQPPDPRQHALAAADFALSRGARHAARTLDSGARWRPARRRPHGARARPPRPRSPAPTSPRSTPTTSTPRSPAGRSAGRRPSTASVRSWPPTASASSSARSSARSPTRRWRSRA